MTADPPADHARLIHWVELLSTILLAMAAVATAWASYQSSRWHGEQAIAGNRSTAARIEATRASGLADRQIQIDVATFVQWVDAYSAGDTELADFYFRRFREEFRPAVAAWVATKPLKSPTAPLTPFAMPQYRSAALADVDRLEETANGFSAQARSYVERADRYVLCVVLFATSLFFAGISTRVRTPQSRAAVLAMGWVLFTATLAWMLTFPVSLVT